MSANVVTLTGLVERPECSVETLTALAARHGTVWLVRFVPVLRGALIVFATADEARVAVQALHGHMLSDGVTMLRAQQGVRGVTRDDVERYSLVPPKQLIQLVSPPPSPPEWWAGWHEHEEGPKPPPELLMDREAEQHELRMVGDNVFEAVALLHQQKRQEELQQQQQLHDHDDVVRPPTITIQAPRGSVVPEGFVVRSPDTVGKMCDKEYGVDGSVK